MDKRAAVFFSEQAKVPTFLRQDILKMLNKIRILFDYIFILSSVSLDDISAVRMGRQSDGLRKSTDEQVEGRCFSIIFKGRRKNLDLIASSDEEAKQWVNSLQKLVSNMNNLSLQHRTEQYPYNGGGYTVKILPPAAALN